MYDKIGFPTGSNVREKEEGVMRLIDLAPEATKSLQQIVGVTAHSYSVTTGPRYNVCYNHTNTQALEYLHWYVYT